MKRCAAITSSRGVGLRSKQKSGVVGGWRAGGVHKCCCCGARRDRLALRLWRTQGMVCEAARTMRMPQGTRGAAHTSPRRSSESSPKLNMTVDEQLLPVRTAAGGADGQGSTVIFRSGGLTLRNSHCVHGRAMSTEDGCPRKSHRWGGAASPKKEAAATGVICGLLAIQERLGERLPHFFFSLPCLRAALGAE